MKYAIMDSHCDTPAKLWKRGIHLDRSPFHVSLDKARKLNGYGQFFAFCSLAGMDTGYTCQQLLWEPYRYFSKELDLFSDRITLCRTGSDYDNAVSAGKLAAYLSLEGAECIACDPGRLDDLSSFGFSMVSLTWNADNALAGSCATDGPGLTAQGKEFVRRAQRLGMVVDVSHISDRAFWDIMDIAEKPIIASHSNSRTLCGHCRNLTDEMFKAICETGGFAGINLCPEFLVDDCNANFGHIYAHMDHFLQMGGYHVALGGDLDGISRTPEGFSGVDDYISLADFLEAKGFSGDTLHNIYSNTMKKVVTLCTM